MYRIMMVEDDITISREVAAHLKKWGYEVLVVSDFEHITEEFISGKPHLLLLDILLPFYNGYYWCSEIRKISKVPVIFLSSAADNMNIVMAVSMGGDDFIPKPFDMEVLTAKIQAMLRRSYDFVSQSTVLEHNGVMLNLTEAVLIYGNERLELTKNELRILQTLMENKNRVVTREALMTKLWENDSYVDENILSVNMNRLRKKLEAIGLKEFIITKKGIGYRIG